MIGDHFPNLEAFHSMMQRCAVRTGNKSEASFLTTLILAAGRKGLHAPLSPDQHAWLLRISERAPITREAGLLAGKPHNGHHHTNATK